MRLTLFLAILPVALTLAASPLGRTGAAQDVTFTDEYLSNPENIQLGRQVWFKRCKLCHGKDAFPGSAPKLKPSRYTPEFVYDRVTNGFRGMPPWKLEFSAEELKAVVAYVLSKRFSP